MGLIPCLIALYMALCLVAGVLGRNTVIGFWGFFFCSCLFTPFVSVLFLYITAMRRH